MANFYCEYCGQLFIIVRGIQTEMAKADMRQRYNSRRLNGI